MKSARLWEGSGGFEGEEGITRSSKAPGACTIFRMQLANRAFPEEAFALALSDCRAKFEAHESESEHFSRFYGRPDTKGRSLLHGLLM